MRAWQLVPTLITFMGRIPGIVAVVCDASWVGNLFDLGPSGGHEAVVSLDSHPGFGKAQCERLGGAV